MTGDLILHYFPQAASYHAEWWEGICLRILPNLLEGICVQSFWIGMPILNGKVPATAPSLDFQSSLVELHRSRATFGIQVCNQLAINLFSIHKGMC